MEFSLLVSKMKNLTRIIIIFSFLIVACSAATADTIKFMPLKDVKVGMTGKGKTVIAGQKIEEFDVEILGILANNKINENLLITGKSILVKVSGDVIKRAGGIAAGMSGSPVYIDGKLVGGISSGWVMTDHTVGLITPIDEMLAIWDYPELAEAKANQNPLRWELENPVKVGSRIIDKVFEFSSAETASNAKVDDKTLCFANVSGPIFVDGLNSRAMGILERKFGKNRIRAVRKSIPGVTLISEKPRMADFNASGTIEPGSAIGIQLARGDINLSTLGTLTHKDGKRVLALSHSFLKKGSVSFLMTGAQIYHSFSSVEMPFKIGAPTEMIGTVNQDREKGISGTIGRLPEMIPVQIDVLDKDLQRTKSINYQIVRDQSVFITVLESTLMQALESVIDREGAGTAQMGISMECSNKEGEKYNFRRENMFFSKTDISHSLVTEVVSVMEMITESEIEEVFPTRILLKVEVEKRRKTVSIEKIEVKNSSITSGGVLDVEVTLRPFREKSFVRKVKIPIPQEIGKENLTLSVYGLNMRADEADMSTDTRDVKLSRDSKAEEPAPADFDSAIRSWANNPKNSDLLFQLTVDGDEMKKIKLNGKDFEIQPTNLVVTGRVDTTLTLSEE